MSVLSAGLKMVDVKVSDRTNGKRAYNYDLLRVVSCIAVIMIHVSAAWYLADVKAVSENGVLIGKSVSSVLVCLYYCISRFAVPCFLMLSGAFVLDSDKNADYRMFYAKSFERIVIPTIIFSLLYILYRGMLCVTGNQSTVRLLKDIIAGEPMVHMWYLYMLIGIYVLVPIVMRFKNSISEKTFFEVSFFFLFLACVSRWTTENVRLNWDIGQSFEYLSFLCVGWSIRRMTCKKNNVKAVFLVFGGVLAEIAAFLLVYDKLTAGISEESMSFSIIQPYAPLIVLASILIFWGFSYMEVCKVMEKVANVSFYIYLIHEGVLDIIRRIYRCITGKPITVLDGAVWIPVLVAAIFVISYFLSKAYLWLWKKIDKDRRVSRRMLRLLCLI